MIDVDKLKETISHTTITVGAPFAGGGIGIIGLCEKIAPVLTVISLLIGITLGILSYLLKRKHMNTHLQHRHQIKK